MGLTIHYSLHSDTRDEQEARRLVEALRRRALDLRFQSVGDLVDLAGEACDFQQLDRDNPHRWLLIQAAQSVERDNYRYQVSPTRLIAFTAIPGEGCEPANFGLCLYPATVEDHEGHKLRTKLAGWSWHSFCKTQYASNPELGGVENFLRCHLSVIELLDHAKEPGILDGVTDESGYWENRDVQALVETVGEWNAMIAGFVGKMKDQLGDSHGGDRVAGEIHSEITKFPDYEHLEAEGRAGEDGDADDDLSHVS